MSVFLINNQETEDAIKDAPGVMSGQIPAKSCNTARELFDELDAEDD